LCNDFLTYQFVPSARPVAGVGDDKIIVNACEATPYHVQENAKPQDTFWIKAQPYSVQGIFSAGHRDLTQAFTGGTIYKAFLCRRTSERSQFLIICARYTPSSINRLG